MEKSSYPITFLDSLAEKCSNFKIKIDNKNINISDDKRITVVVFCKP